MKIGGGGGGGGGEGPLPPPKPTPYPPKTFDFIESLFEGSAADVER